MKAMCCQEFVFENAIAWVWSNHVRYCHWQFFVPYTNFSLMARAIGAVANQTGRTIDRRKPVVICLCVFTEFPDILHSLAPSPPLEIIVAVCSPENGGWSNHNVPSASSITLSDWSCHTGSNRQPLQAKTIFSAKDSKLEWKKHRTISRLSHVSSSQTQKI